MNALPLNLGCGVTAYGAQDALRLLQERVIVDLKNIVQRVEDIDIRTLEEKHVLPNVGM